MRSLPPQRHERPSKPIYLATEATNINCATIIFKQLDDAACRPTRQAQRPSHRLNISQDLPANGSNEDLPLVRAPRGSIGFAGDHQRAIINGHCALCNSARLVDPMSMLV